MNVCTVQSILSTVLANLVSYWLVQSNYDFNVHSSEHPHLRLTFSAVNRDKSNAAYITYVYNLQQGSESIAKHLHKENSPAQQHHKAGFYI